VGSARVLVGRVVDVPEGAGPGGCGSSTVETRAENAVVREGLRLARAASARRSARCEKAKLPNKCIWQEYGIYTVTQN